MFVWGWRVLSNMSIKISHLGSFGDLSLVCMSTSLLLSRDHKNTIRLYQIYVRVTGTLEPISANFIPEVGCTLGRSLIHRTSNHTHMHTCGQFGEPWGSNPEHSVIKATVITTSFTPCLCIYNCIRTKLEPYDISFQICFVFDFGLCLMSERYIMYE